MELIQQVCNLDQAKRLKELGVNTPSLNYYYQYICNGETTYPAIPLVNWNGYKFEEDYSLRSALDGDSKNEIYPAYTVAELGEMLPHDIDGHTFDIENLAHTKLCCYDGLAIGKGKTEAEARADLLINILTNNLYTLPA